MLIRPQSLTTDIMTHPIVTMAGSMSGRKSSPWVSSVGESQWLQLVSVASESPSISDSRQQQVPYPQVMRIIIIIGNNSQIEVQQLHCFNQDWCPINLHHCPKLINSLTVTKAGHNILQVTTIFSSHLDDSTSFLTIRACSEQRLQKISAHLQYFLLPENHDIMEPYLPVEVGNHLGASWALQHLNNLPAILLHPCLKAEVKLDCPLWGDLLILLPHLASHFLSRTKPV